MTRVEHFNKAEDLIEAASELSRQGAMQHAAIAAQLANAHALLSTSMVDTAANHERAVIAAGNKL